MERWRSAAILIFNVSCFVADEGDEQASVRPPGPMVATVPPDSDSG